MVQGESTASSLLRRIPVDLVKLQSHVAAAREAPAPNQRRRGKRPVRELGQFQCGCCGLFKDAAAFNHDSKAPCGLQRWCRVCSRLAIHRFHRTLRGGAHSLASGALRRSVARGWDSFFTFEDILHLLVAQGGRCAYSGVPLEHLIPHSHCQQRSWLHSRQCRTGRLRVQHIQFEQGGTVVKGRVRGDLGSLHAARV